MINVSQKTQFEKLFKEKKFYEIPNPIYWGWLVFKIAACLGLWGLVLQNPRGQDHHWDPMDKEEKGWWSNWSCQVGRYQHREACSFQEQRRRKESTVERSRREEEREAKEKEKEEQIQEKRRKREGGSCSSQESWKGRQEGWKSNGDQRRARATQGNCWMKYSILILCTVQVPVCVLFQID